jgi:hypothetical protein
VRPPCGWALLLVGALGMVGCARTTAPTGGPVPDTPLRLVGTSPEPFQIVEPFDGPVRIQFDRRISERPSTGSLQDVVLVSPQTGAVQVRLRRTGLEVRMEGGFQERTVYRITVLPTLQDLFRNRLERPEDLFFSTGPDFEPNLVAGLLVDRITGRPLPRMRVEAQPVSGDASHVAASDSLGIFAFRFLPAGRYRLVAYEDTNRNREPDFSESQAEINLEFAVADTLVLTELALLRPDTTAAILTRAEVIDSLTVQVSFDDYLDPAHAQTEVRGRIIAQTGIEIPVARFVFPWVWEAERRQARAAAAQPAAEGDDEGADEPRPPAPEREEPEAPRLPFQSLVLILESPLVPGDSARVQVEGVVNLNGVPGGGGDLGFAAPEPPPPPPLAFLRARDATLHSGRGHP